MRWLALLALACSDVSLHSPSVLDPFCTRVAIETYTAPAETCIRLVDANGLTLFKRSDSDSCGGPPCLRLLPGETAFVLAKLRPDTAEPAWLVEIDDCDETPECAE